MALSIFVGIDSNFKTRILAQILHRALEATDNLSPAVLFTDSDPAMLAAIQARYSIAKIFMAEIESTQRVESINSILKKHLDQGTLLKELVNPSTGLPSSYNTIFKDIDSALKEYLLPIPLLLYHTSKLLHYIDQIRTQNIYTSTVQKKADKRIEFGNTMLIAKTEELHSTSQLNIGVVGSSSNSENNEQYPLGNSVNCNLPEITNLEYHKLKGRSPKHLKSSTEKNNNQCIPSSSKTCGYCQKKGHNIRGCKKHKADFNDKENSKYELN
ncbi:43103_t:CDS:2 [Gigaspora margarita]|uniref:43103_t:CDS:1 n=1 Tax=Gigaspora margarita TaxID=4874 RepID=A0ABN7VQE8_GIGMA|nr:43103_t:CDS:2 [Gigaspora margarita]